MRRKEGHVMRRKDGHELWLEDGHIVEEGGWSYC